MNKTNRKKFPIQPSDIVFDLKESYLLFRGMYNNETTELAGKIVATILQFAQMNNDWRRMNLEDVISSLAISSLLQTRIKNVVELLAKNSLLDVTNEKIAFSAKLVAKMFYFASPLNALEIIDGECYCEEKIEKEI